MLKHCKPVVYISFKHPVELASVFFPTVIEPSVLTTSMQGLRLKRFAPSIARVEHLPPALRKLSLSIMKLALTLLRIDEIFSATSLPLKPCSAAIAASITSRPEPVERLKLSTGYTPSSSAAARAQFFAEADKAPPRLM